MKIKELAQSILNEAKITLEESFSQTDMSALDRVLNKNGFGVIVSGEYRWLKPSYDRRTGGWRINFRSLAHGEDTVFSIEGDHNSGETEVFRVHTKTGKPIDELMSFDSGSVAELVKNPEFLRWVQRINWR